MSVVSMVLGLALLIAGVVPATYNPPACKSSSSSSSSSASGSSSSSNAGYNSGDDSGYNSGYDSGYNWGYNYGYNKGYETTFMSTYNDGYNYGYNKGYNKGYNGYSYNNAYSSVNNGYSSYSYTSSMSSYSYTAGYSAGRSLSDLSGHSYDYNSGYNLGYNLGYKSGYQQGDSLNTYRLSYNSGYDSGFNSGYNTGHKTNLNYNSGYCSGYYNSYKAHQSSSSDYNQDLTSSYNTGYNSGYYRGSYSHTSSSYGSGSSGSSSSSSSSWDYYSERSCEDDRSGARAWLKYLGLYGIIPGLYTLVFSGLGIVTSRKRTKLWGDDYDLIKSDSFCSMATGSAWAIFVFSLLLFISQIASSIVMCSLCCQPDEWVEVNAVRPIHIDYGMPIAKTIGAAPKPSQGTLSSLVDVGPGGCIEILPGTYFVNAIIMKDLTLRGMGDQNNTALVSRFCCTLVIESCKVNLENLTLAVSEGTLTDHAMELHEASVTMESCDVYGGTAALFANSNSKIAATHCQYHDAHSFGVALMNSEAEFLDCYFFRNGEDGCNIGGSAAKLELQNCRISDNTCFGVHVHDGASMAANKCNVIKNEQEIPHGGHDSNHLKSTGIMKQSCAEFQDCRIKLNKWQGIFVLDGSLKVLEIYKKCSIDLQKRLHNYPNGTQASGAMTGSENKEGWEDRILRDPKAYMLIERLFRNIEQETDTDIDELDMEIHEFLQDLGLERFVERFRKLDCNAVRDLLPMRDTDFVSGASHAPQHLVPCKFASLIEATKFQARKADKQRNYEEWKKLRSLFADRIGFNTTGADVDTKLRKLFSELDVSRTAGQRGIHVDELKKGLQVHK
ncbi:hypothetical protein GUITHDRAFT_99158 [Guillardia theta CCMP2712]|uniref:Right handed beta helix domain-containing protein n=1 Tax=Guillardia theta (strain CCMP2712) TaxID=905079 RepID=L1K4J2_GUITC|nr:hypothetical protein GUITHDRAFT_99158 [Guillardia theta CCMP2712]EKX55375.1 hypothetical protein GUITHDRAFT_99158 [Guillardia theta CCMP2712]|eukprot:XP_005842355.1 hypothetical protein GUITHDRAFT_99158 [Guillardia theta CCMP2712]